MPTEGLILGYSSGPCAATIIHLSQGNRSRRFDENSLNDLRESGEERYGPDYCMNNVVPRADSEEAQR